MLTAKQRSFLRALAHNLNPVVLTGRAGLTPAVISEIDAALAHHELVKIKLTGDRGEREKMTAEICVCTGCEPVQNIGRIAVVYRPAEKPKISLP